VAPTGNQAANGENKHQPDVSGETGHSTQPWKEKQMKAMGKKKPTAATNKIWKKAAALPRRIWAVGGAIALAVVIA
jgi:hypothetical protein